MKKLLGLFSILVLFSCGGNDIKEYEPEVQFEDQDIVTDASGRQYPFLDPSVISYCGPVLGRKFCRFLKEHDDTVWADTENYFSDFSDIKFSNFPSTPFFISFFNLDTISSRCDGWKLGESTYDGLKRNIRIKKDEFDALWLDYEYYGSSEEIEYTIHYKYEVKDGLLHFSSSDGQTFIFHPSEKDYAEDVVNTDEIIQLEGCLFY